MTLNGCIHSSHISITLVRYTCTAPACMSTTRHMARNIIRNVDIKYRRGLVQCRSWTQGQGLTEVWSRTQGYHFDTIPECVGWTNRQTDKRTSLLLLYQRSSASAITAQQQQTVFVTDAVFSLYILERVE